MLSALVLRAAALLITMSTTVDGDYRTLRPAQHRQFTGVRSVLDQVIRRASSGLMSAHVALERIRIGLRSKTKTGS